AAVLVIGVMIILGSFGPGLVDALKALLGESLGPRSMSDFRNTSALQGLLRAFTQAGVGMAPLLAGVVLIAVMANLVQVGFHLNGKRLQPNLAALNPVSGIGKIFGKGRSPVQMLLNVAKLVLLGAVAYSAVYNRLSEITSVE